MKDKDVLYIKLSTKNDPVNPHGLYTFKKKEGEEKEETEFEFERTQN